MPCQLLVCREIQDHAKHFQVVPTACSQTIRLSCRIGLLCALQGSVPFCDQKPAGFQLSRCLHDWAERWRGASRLAMLWELPSIAGLNQLVAYMPVNIRQMNVAPGNDLAVPCSAINGQAGHGGELHSVEGHLDSELPGAEAAPELTQSDLQAGCCHHLKAVSLLGVSRQGGVGAPLRVAVARVRLQLGGSQHEVPAQGP